VSEHYSAARAHLAENDTLHAEVEALLYVGEQIELATGVLHEAVEKLAPAVDPRLREDMPSTRRKG
jgi:hypothetical protein